MNILKCQHIVKSDTKCKQLSFNADYLLIVYNSPRRVILVQSLLLLMRKRDVVALRQLIVVLMSYDCRCAVAVPHGAVGWSALYV